MPGIKCKPVHGQLLLKGLLAQPTTSHTLLSCSCTGTDTTGLAYNFSFIKFLPSRTVEAVDALQNLFRPPPDSWLRVMARSRRSITAKVCYWEGALQLWFNKICLKMIDHGSRSTWGPGPSRSGLRAQNYNLHPLKQIFPTTFVS